MKVKEIVKMMEQANEFATIVDGHTYEVRSNLTGVHTTYQAFAEVVREEFVDPEAVLNAEVHVLHERGCPGEMKGLYEFDGTPMEFEFRICRHIGNSFGDNQ